MRFRILQFPPLSSRLVSASPTSVLETYTYLRATVNVDLESWSERIDNSLDPVLSCSTASDANNDISNADVRHAFLSPHVPVFKISKLIRARFVYL
ncbi:unnamed protein product [Lasius platythorax]|uniref:Uncharacterized protein n=1 Tax=Lasius platythorax TaxID=488582 RepID=A0AAV2PB20_9HYME